ncbi:MAG: aminotransferase class V-fold PLP-dependent enzyme [Planctomycetota bacterium]|nr:aminotransferase class V-fold PLP-dependent enzyme [Planctomycetota bacterium]
MTLTDHSQLYRPAWPPTTPEIEAEVMGLLREQTWGLYEGSCAERLRENLREQFKHDHVYPCSSGTLSVELALRGMGIGPGDEVVLAGYDFPGNFRAIEAVGATPVLIDVEQKGWALDAEQLEDAFSDTTRAVIASHLHGSLADMDLVVDMTHRHGGLVLEDACQVPGSVIQGRPAGAWGDVSVLSFGGSKLLSAGRGGAVMTSNPEILQRLKVYGERGNLAFPLSELQAAVLIPQFTMLARRHEVRRNRVQQLVQELQDLERYAEMMIPREQDSPAYYKWGLCLKDATRREPLVQHCQRMDVPLDTGFRGFMKRSSRRCRKVGDLTHATKRAAGTVLLHHPVLLQDAKVISKLAEELRVIFKRVFEA